MHMTFTFLIISPLPKGKLNFTKVEGLAQIHKTVEA